MGGSQVLTHCLGFPRMGFRRELKFAVEKFWAGKIAPDALQALANELQKAHWKIQADAGVDWIPSNDFSFYDHVAELSVALGVVPARFSDLTGLDLIFAMARGTESHPPSDLTKWFNTNYHYLVPEISPTFGLDVPAHCFAQYRWQRAAENGHVTVPVVIGPVTFLRLARLREVGNAADQEAIMEALLVRYVILLKRLMAAGVQWVQIDEPILATDCTSQERALFSRAYTMFREQVSDLRLMVTTYFDRLAENADWVVDLPVAGFHLDAVSAPNEVATMASRISSEKSLSVGIIDGRNIWRSNLEHWVSYIGDIRSRFDGQLLVGTSCSLLHCPHSLDGETTMDPEIKSWLSFATEKLGELRVVADVLNGVDRSAELAENADIYKRMRASERIHNPVVQQRVAAVSAADLNRQAPFKIRSNAQQAALKLPAFPTTTIGSFPQTPEIRASRRAFINGEISKNEYDGFIRQEIASTIEKQIELGLDVLVHGESERTDMSEYFGELLDGMLKTQNGWVQSYGSRCVKPPVIYGDISRPTPMTVYWSQYAQSLTSVPVKGMLTGPVTILMWSFKRSDIPWSESAKQLALALRDEVIDLEAAGIRAIQIDEPAIREGTPLREADRGAYFKWAVEAFRLSASGVRNETQIHTHMCYSDFNDIMAAIVDLDADVISIEMARSDKALLQAFVDFEYPAGIGPGVYDIHSPRVPTVEQIVEMLESIVKFVPADRVWVNPDCGLKTRKWEEVVPSLVSMVKAAKIMRESQGLLKAR